MYRRGEQRFLQPGDRIEASIEGIGTLRHTAVAEPAPPAEPEPAGPAVASAVSASATASAVQAASAAVPGSTVGMADRSE